MSLRVMSFRRAGKLLIAALAACALTGLASEEPQKIEYRYEVEEGDTLWDIASMIATDREDVRKIIYDIKAENNLKDAVIVPGQELIIRIAPADK